MDAIRKDEWRAGRIWFARLSVLAVFTANLSAALAYLIWPERYAAGYELQGVVGRVVVQAIGILFLMWNATYPPVIASPLRHQTLYLVVLCQQVIGLIGETWLLLTIPSGHEALVVTGTRFVIFDGTGLVIMAAGFILMWSLWNTNAVSDDQQK